MCEPRFTDPPIRVAKSCSFRCPESLTRLACSGVMERRLGCMSSVFHDQQLMGLFDMMVSAVFDSILADSSFALPQRVLPLNFNDAEVRVPVADGFAVVVREDESCFVVVQQVAQCGVVEVFMVNWEVALRIYAAEHAAVAVQIVRRVAIEERAAVHGQCLLEFAVRHFQVGAFEAADFVQQPFESLLVFVYAGHPS